ncbi:hypothetical protein FHL15_010057 [Xylaria flabelliformis]|uniref:BTB domain-containing protein n=1 Tax=Xylaria flabelliformis TaxID=2512241 RepID=A0A553HM56_9PEZI|nr:hypothetical protein FHL15_010057 [Xylaria flabelliformis]
MMDSNSIECTSSSADVDPTIICSFVPQGLSLKVIDPDGDLSLKVGETRCIYKSGNDVLSDQEPDHEHQLPAVYIVCSKALSRASPVWKTLLYGGFAESKPSSASSASDWVVELPDDDPKAMATILNIIHSRFDLLPRITDLVNLDDLYQLTVLTDKYDLTPLLRPWASIWINSATEKYNSWGCSSTSPVTSDLERLLWIAWELGDPDLFSKTSTTLAQCCSIDANGDLQYNTGNKVVALFNTTPEPPGIYGNYTLACLYRRPILNFLDALKAARLRYIEDTLAIYQKAIAAFTENRINSRLLRVCKGATHDPKKKACDAGILGTMILSLASLGYWPLPAATDIRTNVTKLAADLADVEILSPVHIGCTGVYQRSDRLKLCLKTPPDYAMSSLVKTRMAKQAAKLGTN